MANPINQNLNQFDQLVGRFEQRRRALDSKEALKVGDKEIAKEIISEEIEKGLKTLPPDLSTSSGVGDIPSPSDISSNLRQSDPETEKKLEELVNIALDKGVAMAVILARRTSNAYLIDRLHDQLVDKFYSELIKQGKIKE